MSGRFRPGSGALRYLTLILVAAACVAAGALAQGAVAGWARGAAAPVAAETDVESLLPYERSDGLHYTVCDQEGQIILQTGLFVVPGDEYVAGDNRHYRIVSVDGDRAHAVLLGTFSLDAGEQQAGAAVESGAAEAAEKPSSATIGVYHTHGDESYVTGDGTSSIRGRGGIFGVGQGLVASAQQEGVTVRYASSAAHSPHDSGAYRRSRRTVTGLMRNGAATLLDIHRDTAPRESYAAEVGGKTVSKVMLVVGRANPQMQTTLNFARNFKKTLDSEYPGIVRGIYFGRGGYNQDLSPRAVLLEIGSHRTPKEDAVQTATLIGAALPRILGTAGSPGGGASRASWSNLGWLLLVVLLGGAGYLVFASGGWRQAWDKVGGFVRREFASALAPRGVRRTGAGRYEGPQRRRTAPKSGAAPGTGQDAELPASQPQGQEQDSQGKERHSG
jgi:stage II sporulation protein P